MLLLDVDICIKALLRATHVTLGQGFIVFSKLLVNYLLLSLSFINTFFGLEKGSALLAEDFKEQVLDGLDLLVVRV